VTDIDVLGALADRAIVFQCKVKRLTLEARKGNDPQLRDDFKKAVQHAYDQAHVSEVSLGSAAPKLELADGIELKLPPLPRAPVRMVAGHWRPPFRPATS